MTGMFGLGSCAPNEPNELDKLGLTDVHIEDLTVHAWIADDDDERLKGLMFVTAEEMTPLGDGRERGMLFIFQRDQYRGFWMRNTIIDLDIAYIDEDMKIVRVMTMKALDERAHRPGVAYRYVLEVKAGTLQRYDIEAGDPVDIPQSVLKRSR